MFLAIIGQTMGVTVEATLIEMLQTLGNPLMLLISTTLYTIHIIYFLEKIANL